MRKLLIALTFVLFAFPSTVNAYYTNMPAEVVVGQPDFTTNSDGVSQTKLGSGEIRGLFVDPKGRLIVADGMNHRVMIWNSVPTENGKPADLVLGQPDFNSNTCNNGGKSASTMCRPSGIWSDGERLIVADSDAWRVLIWNTFPTTNGEAADVVVGQDNFTSTVTGCNEYRFKPFTGGTLWVYDNKLIVSTASSQRRVLIWDSVPTENGEPADLVLGQDDFNTCTTQPTSDSSLGSPRGVMVDESGRLFVADSGAHRVLVWNSFPTSNNQPADMVIGQSDFTSDASGVAANKFSHPQGVYFNGERLFVGDNNGRRYLIFNDVVNNSSADIVIGQPDFTSNTANNGGLSAKTSSFAHAVFEYDNRLIVGDSGNRRVLIFPNTISTPKIHIREFEGLSEKLRIHGSVHLGEPENYTLHNVKVSLNGVGETFVSHIKNPVRADNVNIYEWYHDIEYPENNQYTLKITSSSKNADDTQAFYISPFVLREVSINKIVFSVPKDYVSIVKNEISHFEIWNRIDETLEWTKVDGDIATDQIDEHGTVSTQSTTAGEVKVVAVSDGGYRQDSNKLQTLLVGNYINPDNLPIYSLWYPLQINSITGVTRNILSSFMPEGISEKYASSTYNPVFNGVAFSNSTVAMRVTNRNNSEEFREYKTKAINSQWSLVPTLYPSSIVNLSVYDQFGKYNQILPLTIDVN